MTTEETAAEILEHYGVQKEKHEDLAYLKDVLVRIYNDLKEAKLSARGFKLMARKLMRHDSSHWEYNLDAGRYERAAGDVDCKECGQLYVEHPQIQDYASFHMLCDGRIVKL